MLLFQIIRVFVAVPQIVSYKTVTGVITTLLILYYFYDFTYFTPMGSIENSHYKTNLLTFNFSY